MAGADFRDTGRNTKARGKETGKTGKKGLHLERRALKRHFTQASLFAAHAALRREAARAARLARRARAFAEERAAAAKQAAKQARSSLSSPDAALKKKALKKKKAKK